MAVHHLDRAAIAPGADHVPFTRTIRSAVTDEIRALATWLGLDVSQG